MPDPYDFYKESRIVCDAIGSGNGLTTIACALNEAYVAGATAAIRQRLRFAWWYHVSRRLRCGWRRRVYAPFSPPSPELKQLLQAWDAQLARQKDLVLRNTHDDPNPWIDRERRGPRA